MVGWRATAYMHDCPCLPCNHACRWALEARHTQTQMRTICPVLTNLSSVTRTQPNSPSPSSAFRVTSSCLNPRPSFVTETLLKPLLALREYPSGTFWPQGPVGCYLWPSGLYNFMQLDRPHSAELSVCLLCPWGPPGWSIGEVTWGGGQKRSDQMRHFPYQYSILCPESNFQASLVIS